MIGAYANITSEDQKYVKTSIVWAKLVFQWLTYWWLGEEKEWGGGGEEIMNNAGENTISLQETKLMQCFSREQEKYTAHCY